MENEIKETKAYRAIETTDTAVCPYCGAGDNDNINITTVENGCTIVKASKDFANDEANSMVFECTCWDCDKVFKVDYFDANYY